MVEIVMKKSIDKLVDFVNEMDGITKRAVDIVIIVQGLNNTPEIRRAVASTILFLFENNVLKKDLFDERPLKK